MIALLETHVENEQEIQSWASQIGKVAEVNPAEKTSLTGNHGGETIEKEAWRRYPGGIVEKETGRKTH